MIYPEYAVLDRPDPRDDRRELSYSYRGGFDDPSTSSKDSDARVVDLAAFDTKAVVGVLRGAPETLGIKPEDVTSTYLVIEPGDDPTAPGVLEVSIYVSSDFGGGYIALNPDASVKRINYPLTSCRPVRRPLASDVHTSVSYLRLLPWRDGGGAPTS